MLGHSFGCFVALTSAVDEPGHAARVIASCGAASTAVFDDFEERLVAFGRPEVFQAFEGEEAAATDDEVRAVWRGEMPFFCADPDGAACAALQAQLDGVRFRVDAAHAGAAFAGYDVRPGLASVDVAVLAIAGAQDRATPADAGREIAGLAPEGTFSLIEHAGHFPYAEQPEAYLDAVARFLTRR